MVKKILLLVLVGSMIHAGGDAGESSAYERSTERSQSEESTGPFSDHPVLEQLEDTPCLGGCLGFAALGWVMIQYRLHPENFGPSKPSKLKMGRDGVMQRLVLGPEGEWVSEKEE